MYLLALEGPSGVAGGGPLERRVRRQRAHRDRHVARAKKPVTTCSKRRKPRISPTSWPSRRMSSCKRDDRGVSVATAKVRVRARKEYGPRLPEVLNGLPP